MAKTKKVKTPLSDSLPPENHEVIIEPKKEMEEMAEFIFLTNSADTTTFDGPSGFRYQIVRRNPFVVKNKMDVEFFSNNKRFEKIGLVKKLLMKPDLQKNPDMILEDELKTIKGLSEETIKNVVNLYYSIDHITDITTQNYDFDPSIPDEEGKLIRDHFKNKE